MIYELVPWRQLTRAGIPPLKVARRPLVVGEVSVGVGETFSPELFPLQIRAERLRQFYEQRRLEPVDPPPNSRQYYREVFDRVHGHSGDPTILAEIPVTPVTPVATRIVADLPSVEVPVMPAKSRPVMAKPKPKGAK
jgi:hypothetical protein